MNISQISNNLIMPLNIGNKKGESNGDFASMLSGLMGNQGTYGINPQSMISGISPDFNKIQNVGSMSNVEFKDFMTSIQGDLKANGIDTSNMPDVTKMTDSELTSFKMQTEERYNQLHDLFSDRGVMGIGGIGGSSQSNAIQSFVDSLLNAVSMGEDEEEELIPQIPQMNNSYMSTADFLSLHQMALNNLRA